MQILFKKVSRLATVRASRSKEKTKIILDLLKAHPESKASEWIKVAKFPNPKTMNGR
ncbi:hypothetical protein [uncultured Anaerococcus sp.]|uniref:hypothetical protein n=1 Tax=uncultured Anaerococcus sp. TaxID=293428 RepID=UPI00280AE493|nr:hypothetical protein [uncultured Anaerococcus sp.]MDU5149075.1 hypothetical protein [Anaerococcus prevotii]